MTVRGTDRMMTSKGTYCLVSLGCPKNLVDSERMAGLLRRPWLPHGRRARKGPISSSSIRAAHRPAREESHAAIREMLDLKERGGSAGSLSPAAWPTRSGETAGPLSRRRSGGGRVRPRRDFGGGRAFARRPGRAGRTPFRPASSRPLANTGRLRITPSHLAFLKTSEGCNRTCSFCSIPQMRGRFVSKPIEQIVAEARELAADGVGNRWLIAQDGSYYGLDLYGRPRLADLLRQLDHIEGLAWIRLMYLYPMYISDELDSDNRHGQAGAALPGPAAAARQ